MPDTHREYSFILFTNELGVWGLKHIQPEGGHILITRGVTMILFLKVTVYKREIDVLTIYR